jgi:GxxExxY protein
MKVHNALGKGFQERIYQRSLALEFQKVGIVFTREVNQAIFYNGISIGTRKADFVADEKIVVELNALTNLEDIHIIQAKNYLMAFDFPIGLLINFGAGSLQYKRIFNPNFQTMKK